MIPAERIVRLARNLVGEAHDCPSAYGAAGRTDPIEHLPYPHELDLEDRATVLRLWSGEAVSDELVVPVRPTPVAALTEVLDLLRDVVVDRGISCDALPACSCSTARAVRLLAGYGIKVEDQ